MSSPGFDPTEMRWIHTSDYLCHEEVSRRGYAQPCDKTAVAVGGWHLTSKENR